VRSQHIHRHHVHIAVIDHLQRFEGRDAQRIIVAPQQQRLFANGARAEACAAAIRSRSVVGHADDGHVCAGHIARVRRAAKGADAVIGLKFEAGIFGGGGHGVDLAKGGLPAGFILAQAGGVR
jgi:hypothetical protein